MKQKSNDNILAVVLVMLIIVVLLTTLFLPLYCTQGINKFRFCDVYSDNMTFLSNTSFELRGYDSRKSGVLCELQDKMGNIIDNEDSSDFGDWKVIFPAMNFTDSHMLIICHTGDKSIFLKNITII